MTSSFAEAKLVKAKINITAEKTNKNHMNALDILYNSLTDEVAYGDRGLTLTALSRGSYIFALNN